MPRFLNNLIETSAVDADTVFHVMRNVSGVYRDRKITKPNLALALGGGLPSEVAGKYRFKLDGTFQLWNATQSKWHSLTISGAAGAEELGIGAGET